MRYRHRMRPRRTLACVMKHPTGRRIAFSLIAAAALALGTPVSAFAQPVGEAKGTVSIADGWNGFSWAIQSMVSRDLHQRRGQ